MLLIYTQKITPRIVYIFKHICTHILGISIKFTSKIEEFIAHEGMKLSYGKQALGNEFFIQNANLLLEQGVTEFEIKVQPWGESICFFPNTSESDLPFDIFAASFFLLSRYEEYLPHSEDDAGRFPASESLAGREGFLYSPVVDIWAYKFRDILKERFEQIDTHTRQFETCAVIAVEHVFNYRNKSFVRSLVGGLNDLFHLKFSKVYHRLNVLLKIRKDPYDIFNDLIELIKKQGLEMIFLFQVSDFSKYDRNINHNQIPYRSVIKNVGDYAKTGLLMGSYAIEKMKVLRKEKQRMENIVHYPLEAAMNSKYNLDLPDVYNNLSELEIGSDYSMGYPDTLGFRAGTCTPFLFYDLNIEITTPLKVHPYIFNSQIFEQEDRKKMQLEIGKILQSVKRVEGNFCAIFKNQDFSEYNDQDFYYSLLKKIHGLETD